MKEAMQERERDHSISITRHNVVRTYIHTCSYNMVVVDLCYNARQAND